ncbi:MAG TPA: c-type cytochrome [Thermoanaerobaculia bacterium]|jgi:cytochrome c1
MKRFAAALALLVLAACHPQDDDTARQLTGGEPRRGQAAIESYGCGTCHVIPGVDTASGNAGPPLTNIGNRLYLAGELPNTPDNMIRWVRSPQSIEKDTMMPDLKVTEHDARDIAAYLYTLRK